MRMGMKTVMIVDKDNNLLEKLREFLNKDEYEVITANSNRSALEYIDKTEEGKINLLLLDTTMPGTNTSAFFSMKPKTNMKNDNSTIQDFLQKPFTKEQFVDFIRKNMMK